MTDIDGDAQEIPEVFFRREDESSDARFYSEPRLVKHIDVVTIEALTVFYAEVLRPGDDLLDLMSSWISHLPPKLELGRVSGLGMNQQELEANGRLEDFVVQDLNTTPRLPYADDTFDVCTIVVSIQYLVRPVEVMKEVRRVLRANGRIFIAMSHRCFPTKAVLAFRQLPAAERVALVQQYLRLAGFEEIGFIDRSPELGDPLWIVEARKEINFRL